MASAFASNSGKVKMTTSVKKITEMFDTKSELIDIPSFQKYLVDELEKKGILSTYRSENIPAPKKNVPVNETSIDKGKGKKKGDKGDAPEDPEVARQLKEEFLKARVEPKIDNANAKLYKDKAL